MTPAQLDDVVAATAGTGGVPGRYVSDAFAVWID
jgi:hypothetical protein